VIEPYPVLAILPGNGPQEVIVNDKTASTVEQVSITIQLDLSDDDACQDALAGFETFFAKLGDRGQAKVVFRSHPIATGRPPLTDEEWTARFDLVKQVQKKREEMGITLEQACARVGIAYSSFRRWRQNM
jgi:hypothetical protein